MTKITPAEHVEIRLVGTPAAVAAAAAWLRAQGLDIQEESSDRASRKNRGQVLRYLVARAPGDKTPG